jgi:hypothetical protein
MSNLGFFFVEILYNKPNKLQAEAKENLVRVELSLNIDMAKPDENILVDIL